MKHLTVYVYMLDFLVTQMISDVKVGNYRVQKAKRILRMHLYSGGYRKDGQNISRKLSC